MKWIKDQALACTGAQYEEELDSLLQNGETKTAEGAPGVKKMEMKDGEKASDKENDDKEEAIFSDSQDYDQSNSYLRYMKDATLNGLQGAFQYLHTVVWGSSRGGYKEVGGGNNSTDNTESHTSGGGIGYQTQKVFTINETPKLPDEIVNTETKNEKKNNFVIDDDESSEDSFIEELDKMKLVN